MTALIGSERAGALPGRRGELVALWRVLAARGAVFMWHDLDALTDDVVEALCAAEARRIRALVEGEASGWMPGRPLPRLAPPPTTVPRQPTPTPDRTKAKEAPVKVHRHRPAWRASA